MKAAIASGDREPSNPDLQTLNPLFPRGNYFTEASLLGPQNFFDVHPCLRLQPAPNWSFDTGLDFYWRQNLNDGIYTPGSKVIFCGDPTLSRFVGTDFSFVIGWQANRHLNISAGYTHFFAGKFIRQNGGKGVNYGTIWDQLPFLIRADQLAEASNIEHWRQMHGGVNDIQQRTSIVKPPGALK